MRVLGIDYGSRRTGIALGDTEAKIASPWRVIEAEETADVIQEIQTIIREERIGQMIVGVPRPLRDRDQENDQVVKVKNFITELRKLALPVHEEDEVLSSGLAGQQMLERGQKGKRDDLAAAVILQSWLDRHAVSS
jgi:putative Holliday junction resolvase